MADPIHYHRRHRLRQRHRRAYHPRRRGQTMVVFALFLFAFMALAALVIDIGFGRLAQRQMQTAADSAAIEGLRGDGSIDDGDRQAAARDFVAWHFDDDLDSNNDDDGAFDSGSGRFGAGPLVEFTGGAGDPSLVASQLISVDPDAAVYKPEMLDGIASDRGPEEGKEFRVAIQRGVADVPAADLYSLGPAVPYFFARGSFVDRSLIQRGIAVSGTGIARKRPVLSVGRADDTLTPALPGLASFTLELDYWNGLTTDLVDGPLMIANEQPVITGEPPVIVDGMGMTVGRFFEVSASDPLPVVIGRPLPDASAPADGTYSGYVAIYAAVSDGTSDMLRVVGFGRATAVVETTDGTPTVQITRMAEQVAEANASAVVCYPLTLSSIELVNTLTLNAEVSESLMAPVSGSADP